MPEPTIMSDKTALRRERLAARSALPPEQVAAFGADIARHVRALPVIAAAETILSFVGAGHGETPTRDLIAALLETGKRIWVPAAWPHGVMTWAPLDTLEDLIPGPRGVPIPRAAPSGAAPPAEAPCLAPGVVFDRQGGRIGYGAGCFDRFLAAHAGPAIGLAYEMQLVAAVPMAPHDQRMRWLVTEMGVIDCRAAADS